MKIIHLRFGGIFFVIALALTGFTAFSNNIGTKTMVSRALGSAIVFCLIGILFSIILNKAGFFVKSDEEPSHNYATPNKLDQNNIPKDQAQPNKQSSKTMEPFNPEAIDPEVSNILNRLPKGGAESTIQNAVDAMRIMGFDDE